MQIVIGSLVALATGAGWARWCSRGLVTTPAGSLGPATPEVATGRLGPPGMVTAASASLVVACCLRPGPLTGAGPGLAQLIVMSAFGCWASGLAALAFIDGQTLTLPKKAVEATGLFVVTALFLSSYVARHWSSLLSGLACAAIVFMAMGAWAILAPENIGFGDVRFSGLVAFGAGVISPSFCVVALAAAVFACGLASRFGHKGCKSPQPVALGPFLALAGVTCVVASAS